LPRFERASNIITVVQCEIKSHTQSQSGIKLHKLKVTNKSNYILHMFSTAARLVRAHLEFCKSQGQTQ